MGTNSFLYHFKIKHRDLPYILVYLILYVVVVGISILTLTVTSAILVAVSCLVILFLLLSYHFHRKTQALFVQQQQKSQAYHTLFNFIDFRYPPPYMTGWAATPELSLALYKIVKIKQPKQIVELGSAISSLICCYGLEQNGEGTLTSFDHEESYGQQTYDMLVRHRLKKYASIKHAPLIPQNIEGHNCTWYDKSVLNIDGEIDLLIVDGPPYQTQSKARFPAMSFFYEKLSEHAVVVIHDTSREEETTIIEEWLTQYPEFVKEFINSEKGITILRR